MAYCSRALAKQTKNRNVIRRIKNNFIEAINKNLLLPKIVIIVLEEDLLKAINHYKVGASLAIEPCVHWLMSELHELSTKYKTKLPTKARKFRYPQFLWISAVFHDGFKSGNYYREKFNTCLMQTSSKFREMHVLHLSAWNTQDSGNMSNFSFTPHGHMKYWSAVKNAFQAWDKHQMRNNIPARIINHTDRCNSKGRNDRFHWTPGQGQHRQ